VTRSGTVEALLNDPTWAGYELADGLFLTRADTFAGQPIQWRLIATRAYVGASVPSGLYDVTAVSNAQRDSMAGDGLVALGFRRDTLVLGLALDAGRATPARTGFFVAPLDDEWEFRVTGVDGTLTGMFEEGAFTARWTPVDSAGTPADPLVLTGRKRWF